MRLQSGGFSYFVLNGNGCAITDFTGTEDTVFVPQTLDGYRVLRIGMSAFIRNDKLKTVILPETVTKIDNMAFYECGSLNEIVIPDSVTEICYDAFRHCKSLNVRIGKGVTEIQSCALNGVRRIEVSAGNHCFCAEDGNLYSKDKKIFLQYTRKEGETSFTVPEGVVRVGNGAFIGCEHLAEIRLPESLKTIGWSAFEGCTRLKSLVIPDATETLNGGAFTNCTELKEISVGVGLQTIGTLAFKGCFSLERLLYGGTMAQWREVFLEEDWADGAPCLRVETMESVSERKDGSPSPFLDYIVNADGKTCTVSGIGLCTDRKLVFPTEIDGYAVTEIGKSEPWDNCFSEFYIDFEGTFEGRGDVESVFVPDGVTAIGDCAFKNCALLKSVRISGTVTKIGASAFEGCTALESVFLGNGVKEILPNAFLGCTALKEVWLPDSVTEISDGVFAGGVAKIAVSPEHPSFVTIDGNLYSRDMRTLLQYAAGKADTAFRCPEAVTEIGERAFLNCTALTDIVLGENVKSIGKMAFLGCGNLSFIHIPDSVMDIEEEAFSGCAKLACPRFGCGLVYLGASAFENCASLRRSPLCEGITEVRWGTFERCNSLRKIHIPDTVTKIADRSFERCPALREVSLPAGLTYLDGDAFRNCTSLKTLSFRGTVAQWREFFREESLSSVRTVVCADGEITLKE